MLILSVVLCFAIYAGYNYIYIPTKNAISQTDNQIGLLKGQVGDTTPLDEKLKQLNTQKANQLNRITEIKKLQKGKTINKQEFLMFLGEECTRNTMELINFNDLGVIQDENEVCKVQFDFELRGNMSELNKFCDDLNSLGVKYSVGGLSLRQNENYPYLIRFFDDVSKLEWYKDPTPPKQEEVSSETPLPGIPLIPPVYPNIIEPQSPTIQPAPPQEITPSPTPTPEPEDKDITDRLNKLLELSNKSTNYRIVFLSNSLSGDEMRLNITIEFIMYEDPKNGGIFNEVL